jgi:endonuclease YncB( thermonuclease family)
MPRSIRRSSVVCCAFVAVMVLAFAGIEGLRAAAADPLAPPEAAVLTTRLLDGKVWLVHAVIVRVIDGDTVLARLDLGWHTWRDDEHVRLSGIDAPERTDLAGWIEAKSFVERLLPAGTEVLLVAEKLEKYGRTLGRILLRDGRDVGAELVTAGLAKPYAGVVAGLAKPALSRELTLTTGPVRAIEACEEAGSLLRYRVGDAWFVVPLHQVRRIEPPCDAAAPPGPAAVAPAPVPTVTTSSTTADPAPVQTVTPSSATATPPTSPDPPAPLAPTTSAHRSSGDASSGGTVHVRGYTRKDGTYVAPHTRSTPGSGRRR